MDEDEVEVMETSFSFFTSQKSKRGPCKSEAKADEDRSSCRDTGTALVCNCSEEVLLFGLKDAVERGDFEFVVQTLRGRELRFKRSEETLKRELDGVRESGGNKYDELRRDYELALEREFECRRQCDRLREENEGLVSAHKKTQVELEDLKKLAREREVNVEEILGGLKEVIMEEKDGELENSKIRGCEVLDGGQVEPEPSATTPCTQTCTPIFLNKSVRIAKEGEAGGGSRVKRRLHFPKEESAGAAGSGSSGYQGKNEVGIRSSDIISDELRLEAAELRNEEETEVKGNIVIILNDEQPIQSDPMNVLKDDIESAPASIPVNLAPSAVESSQDGLQCPFTEHNPDAVVIISDTESEGGGMPLRTKSIKACSEKASCTPKNQTAEAETQNMLNTGGSLSDGEHSDPSEKLMQRSAKIKRGHRGTVISESESDGNDAGFGCKRRKSRRLELKKQGTKGNGPCEIFLEGSKEDEDMSVAHEPYDCSKLDGNLGMEGLLSSEAAGVVPDVKFRRIRRMKDVNELSIQVDISPATEFRSLQEDKGETEVPDAGQFEEEICSADRAPVTNYRRLKRGGETSGPEKSENSKVGKTTDDMQEHNTSNPDTNDKGDGQAFMGGSIFANEEKSDKANKLAEGQSERPVYSLNTRARRNRPKKMINLTKDSDGDDDEEEGEDAGQVEDLSEFIVDSSESGTDSECSNRNTSDSVSRTRNLDSEASSEEDLNEVIRKISRRSKNTLNWKYEADMLSALAKDDVLCMRAICALYRQQTNDEKCGKSSLYLNRRGFDKYHASRGSLLAEFLTDKDPFGPVKKTVDELLKYDSKGVRYCRDLAIHHSKQLFEIHQNHEDQHFPHR